MPLGLDSYWPLDVKSIFFKFFHVASALTLALFGLVWIAASLRYNCILKLVENLSHSNIVSGFVRTRGSFILVLGSFVTPVFYC